MGQENGMIVGMKPHQKRPVPPSIQPPAAPPQYVYVEREPDPRPWENAMRAGVALNVILLLVAGAFALSGGAASAGEGAVGAAGGLLSGGLMVLLDLVYWIGVVVVFIMLLVHGAAWRAVGMVVVSALCFLLSMVLMLGGVVGFLHGGAKSQEAAAAVRAEAEQREAMESGLRRDELLVEVAKAAKLSKLQARQEARKRLMEQSWQGMVDADGAAVRKAIEEQLGPTPEPMLKE